jgi:thioredoxin
MENLNKDTFKEKVFDYENNEQWEYKGDKPAIIDFYADWCAPCKMLTPVLEDLSKSYEGKVKIYKVDTEKEPELSGMFGIRSIPSILFIPVDDKPQMANGALPKETLEKLIKDVLKVDPD